MILMIRAVFFVFTVNFALVPIVWGRGEGDPGRLLHGTEKPTAQQVLELSTDAIRSQLGDPDAVSSRDRTVFELYELMIAELRRSDPHSVILIFGRDGEEFFDAYSTVANADERRRIFLFNASRPLVRNSSDAALMYYMQMHGMRIQDILEGRQKVVWIDSGSRGSIYIALLTAIIRQIPNDDPQRAQKLRNVFRMISPKLIVAWGRPSMEGFAEDIISNGTPNEQVLNFMFSRLYFEQIPRLGRDRFGMDGDDASKRRWVVDHIEHIPKWGPRTLRVTESGVVEYEAPEPHINKTAYLLNQAKVVRYFQKKMKTHHEEKSSSSPIEIPLSRLRGREEVVVSSAVTEEIPEDVSMTDFGGLLKTVREHPTIEVRNLALEKIIEMTRNPTFSKQIIEQFANSPRFAHIVYKHAEMFPRRFLDAYYSYVKSQGYTDGPYLRMMRSCEKLFEK